MQYFRLKGLTHWISKFFFMLTGVLALSVSASPLQVGLTLDKGGRDDKSFNASAYQGGLRAEKELGIRLKTVTASDDTAIEPSLRTFAQKKFDLVIGIGFVFRTAVEKVAKDFPNTKFLVIDTEVNAPNVRSILFNEHEGSYLVGALAGLTTKTNKVGFIGGMDIPLIQRFRLGYEAGVKSTNPKAQIVSNFVGSGSDAWRNPTRGKELALAQYKNNVDIIFHGAGASGLGVFDAAEELSKLAIGTDSNQNWIKPGKILTSMVKEVGLGVYKTIEDLKNNQFKSGVEYWGLEEGAISYSIDEYNRSLVPPEVEARLNSIRQQIIEKKIEVPDYYKLQKKNSSATSNTENNALHG